MTSGLCKCAQDSLTANKGEESPKDNSLVPVSSLPPSYLLNIKNFIPDEESHIIFWYKNSCKKAVGEGQSVVFPSCREKEAPDINRTTQGARGLQALGHAVFGCRRCSSVSLQEWKGRGPTRASVSVLHSGSPLSRGRYGAASDLHCTTWSTKTTHHKTRFTQEDVSALCRLE